MYSGALSPHGQRSFPSGPATGPFSLTSPAPRPRPRIRRPARLPPGARPASGARVSLRLAPPAVRVEGALRAGHVVPGKGRRGLGGLAGFFAGLLALAEDGGR